MSTNCLVKKMKGSVTNENLPILGKIILGYPDGLEQTDSNKYFRVAASEGNTVKISVVGTTIHETGTSEVTFSDTVMHNFHLDKVDSSVKVIIDGYNVKLLLCIAASTIIGLNTLNYGEPKRISFNQQTILKEYVKSLKNVEVIRITSIDNASDRRTFIENNKDTLVANGIYSPYPTDLILPKIKRWALTSGDIADLPVSIVAFDIYNGVNGAYGSLDTFIAKKRNAGITSGKIWAQWLSASRSITFTDNGSTVTCRQWCDDHSITPAANTYLVWDANSISLTLNAEGATPYPDIDNLLV